MDIGQILNAELEGLRRELLVMKQRIDTLEQYRGGQLAYSVKECAEVLGTGEHNIRALIRSNQLPHFTLENGKQRYMIYRCDLEEFIRKRKLES